MIPAIYNKKTGVFDPYIDKSESGVGSQNLREESIEDLRRRVAGELGPDELLVDGELQIYDKVTGELLPPPLPSCILLERIAFLETRVAALESRAEPEPQGVVEPREPERGGKEGTGQ